MFMIIMQGLLTVMGGILNTITSSLKSNDPHDMENRTAGTEYDRDKTELIGHGIDTIDKENNDKPVVSNQSSQNSKLCFLQQRNMAVTSAEAVNDDSLLTDKTFDNVLLDSMQRQQPEGDISVAIQKSIDVLQKNLTTLDSNHVDSLSTEGVKFPHFSGDEDDNFNAFVTRLDSCFKFLKWSDGTKCNYVPLTLADRARTYYDSLPVTVINDYVQLMTALEAKFGMSAIGVLKNSHLLDRRQATNESVSEYSKAILDILQKLNIQNDMIRLTSYLRGLRSDIRLAVLPHRPTNISEAEDIAILLERQINAVTLHGSHVNQKHTAAAVNHVQKHHKLKRGACFNCGHFSHYVRDCPSKKRNYLNV